ncbi:MAG: MFS transporter [Actinomycetes bacterium]
MSASQVRMDNRADGRHIVGTLAVAAVFGGLGTASTTPAGSLLITKITGNDSLAGLTQTSGLVGAAIAAAVLAKITSNHGRRVALSAGYAAAVIGSALAVIAAVNSSALLLLLAAMLVGCAVATALQARFAAVDTADDSNRSKRLSFVVWGSTIGAVTGPNLIAPSGHFAQQMHLPPLAGPYLISGSTLAIAAVVIMVLLRPDPYLVANRTTTVTRHPVLDTLTVIHRNPPARLGLWTLVVGHVAMVSIMVMTPVHMKHDDMGLSIIGFVISVHVAGMYAFSPLVGAAAQRWGRKPVILAGLGTLLAAAAVAGTAMPMDALQLEIGLFLLGAGWSMTLIGGSTLLAESIEADYKISAQGASDVLMSASAALFGGLAGVVIAELSYAWLCAFASPLLIAVAVMALRTRTTLSPIEVPA